MRLVGDRVMVKKIEIAWTATIVLGYGIIVFLIFSWCTVGLRA